MRHTDKNFWNYAIAYILIGSSLLIIVLQILIFTFAGEKPDHPGAGGGLLMGTWFLSTLKRKKPVQVNS